MMLLLTSFALAETLNLSVNMKVKALEGTFDPTTDVVFASGDWNGYNDADTLRDLDHDSIYTGAVTVATPPVTIGFKFRYWDASASSFVWENDPNRSLDFTVDGQSFSDFFDRDDFVSLPTTIDFRVNMKIKALKGTFDPTADIVLIRGGMNAWGTSDTLTDPNHDSIYTKTISGLFQNTEYGFKFFYWDASNGSSDTWENDPNRTYTATSSTGSYEDYFNKDSVYHPTTSITVYFTCNMELERLSGRFHPGTDTVSVNGDFNGWASKTTILNSDPLSPDDYKGSFVVTAGAGDGIQFKFWYEENNWESVDNRHITFTQQNFDDQEAEFSAPFNNGTLESVLNQPCTVKLTVYTVGARSSVSGNPFPVVNTIGVAGSSSPLKWPGGGWPNSDSVNMIWLYDDGSHGDLTAADGIFSLDLEIPAYTVLQTQYKYSANFGDAVNNEGGNDNENGFGNNHLLNLTKFTTGVVVVDAFGVMGASTAKSVLSLSSGWNMVSVPRTVADFSASAVFSGSASSVFAYNHGYVTKSTLQIGEGYWVKYGSASSVSPAGPNVTAANFPVKAGWNIIGALGVPINVTSITSTPGGLVTSPFWGYAGSYSQATTLQPGQGYWVKILEDGMLNVSTLALDAANRIKIVQSNELPPAPPEALTNNENGKPTVFALNQNYPNPFNPSTLINYSLPTSEYVSLKVFNLLGQEVATLVNGVQDAGYKAVEFNSSNLPSGIYFYKIQAGSFSDLKKMVIMK